MDKNGECFLQLIAAFLKGTEPASPHNVDWNRVYELSKIHYISGAVYVSVKKLPAAQKPPKEVLNRFSSAFFNTLLRSEKQDALIGKIAAKFAEMEIPHIFIKGAVLRKYYPVTQMRTFGDVDMIIHGNDRLRTDTALRKIGCVLKAKGDVGQYMWENLLIEVHDKIDEKQVRAGNGCADYFDHIWEHALATDNDFAFELDKNYQLVYLIFHTAKHLYQSGCGVRMLTDIAVILDHDGSELNFGAVLSELKKIRLDRFALNLFALCKIAFSLPDTFPCAPMTPADYADAMKYILDAGTFGVYRRSPAVNLIRREYENTDSEKKARFMALWHKLFLNRDELRLSHPRLAKCGLLLPLAWAARGCSCLLFKGKRTASILKDLMCESDKARKAYIVLKKLGLE